MQRKFVARKRKRRKPKTAFEYLKRRAFKKADRLAAALLKE